MNLPDDETIAANRAAVATARAALPLDEVDLSTRLIKLATSLKSSVDPGEVESLLREALSLRRRLLTNEHPMVAAAATYLGRLIEESGRFAEAEPLYREALATFRIVLPPGHPHLNLPLRNLAASLEELHSEYNLDEACTLFREALTIARAPGGSDELTLAETLSDLGSHLSDRGNHEQADPLLSESVEILRRLKASTDLNVANVLVRFARLRVGQRRMIEAERAAREAVEIRERHYPADDHRVAKSKSLLGLTLAGLGRFEEAEVLLLVAYEVMHTTEGKLGAGPPRTNETINRIVDLYRRWGKPDRAADWLERRV